MSNKLQRILSLVLVFVMFLTSMPNALATGIADGVDGVYTDTVAGDPVDETPEEEAPAAEGESSEEEPDAPTAADEPSDDDGVIVTAEPVVTEAPAENAIAAQTKSEEAEASEEVVYVASYKNYSYTTLSEAFADAVSRGGEITLLKNVTETVRLSVADGITEPKTITLNLNGYRWTCGAGSRLYGMNLTIKNGKVGSSASEVLYFGGHKNVKSTLTIDVDAFNAELRVNDMAPTDEELESLFGVATKSVEKKNATKVFIERGAFSATVTVQKGAYLTVNGGTFKQPFEVEEGAFFVDNRPATDEATPAPVTVVTSGKIRGLGDVVRTKSGVTTTIIAKYSTVTEVGFKIIVPEGLTEWGVKVLEPGATEATTFGYGSSYDAESQTHVKEYYHTFTSGETSVTYKIDWNNNGTWDELVVLKPFDKTHVAEIPGLGTYASLQDAVNAVRYGETITLLQDVTEKFQVEVPVSTDEDEKTTFTIDLDGYTLTGSILAPNAVLTVKNGSIKNTDSSVSAIEINAGELVLENVNISSARHAVRIDGEVTATINGGNYTLTGTSGTRHAVNVSGAANVTILGGTFVGPKGTTMDSGSAVNVQTGATVTIEGGSFSGGKSNTLQSAGALIVKGGTFDQDPSAYTAEGYFGLLNESGLYEVAPIVASIGDANYASLEAAAAAAETGDTIEIHVAGTYTVPTGKSIAITGMVDGVVFDNIGACNMGGASMGFNNVTFDYYPNATYTGLQHADTISYNDCTFNGQMFLYGNHVGFCGCTFNQTSSDAYNVWTYGAKAVVFDKCTFNSAGKSVLIYKEADDPSFTTAVTVMECTFTATSAVEGKAAIEMDSSLIAGIILAIDAETTADGFGTGNVSRNSLWNNKRGNEGVNNDITVTVDGDVVLQPIKTAQVGDVIYTTIEAAIEAAADGDTVTLLDNIAQASSITINKSIVLDLNGKTITGTDNATSSFGLINIQPGAVLTINDTVGGGKITLTSANNRGWSAYSSVISNQRGTLTVNGGTIEHLGGTDMAYAIDNLTNGKGTYAKTVINGGTIKSTYRAIRQFLNSVEAQNILTINGGTIEGANRSVWMQDASAAANSGTLTVSENATLKGDVYLFVNANSTEWPVEVSIATAALADGAQVQTANVPAGYELVTNNGVISVDSGVAKIGSVWYDTFADALTAASALTGDVTVELYDKVTLNTSLSGSYDSIKFVGKDTDAEIYLDVQGYITAHGKKVAFEDLTLSKVQGGFITNVGFMNVAFGVYDVAKVTYTNCSFTNGAYASSGDVTFTGCTFHKSWDKYGLWAYGDADITVSGCTFADARGIKMYAENKQKVTNLTVTGTDFSAVTDKPAIVLTYGESVTLRGNTYSSTGVFELDLDGAPNGVAVTSDVTPTCVNDNGKCGVLVDGKIYTTAAQAAKAAVAGSEVTLLHESTETVEFVYGVELDKNGFTADGLTVATAAAQTGDTNYGTLAEALEAVADGGTISLLKNVTINETTRYDSGNGWYEGVCYAGDKSFTIDLGGFTLTNDSSVNDYLMLFKNTGSKANVITITNGTVEAAASAYCAICTSGSSTQQITINLEKVNVIGNNSNGSVVKVRANTVLNVKAGTVITGNDSYLGIECISSTANIYDGAKIYMNGTTSYNGCLVGVGGNGTVNVYGGYGKGVKGGLIAMTSGGTINVSGGEWIANTDGTDAGGNASVLIAQSNKQYNAGAGNSVVNVTGGTFKGGYNCYGDAVGDAEINISGGNFNIDPSAYVVARYVAVTNDAGYDVVDAVAAIGDTYYATIAAAIAAANTGDTVTILAGAYAVPTLKAGITLEGETDADGNAAVLLEGTLTSTLENLTLKNLHIKGGNAQRWAYGKGNLVFENVTFEATSVYALHFDGITAGSTLLYKNCTIIGWVAMSGSPTSCVFDGCTIKDNGAYGVIRTYFDATIQNCTFDVDGANSTDQYQDGIHAVKGATVTVNSCTNVNGDMVDLVNVGGTSVVVLDGVEIRNVATIGDNYYRTLAEAVEAVEAGGTITLIADVTVAEGETVAINGFNLAANEGVTLTNNGTVNITDATVKLDKLDNDALMVLSGTNTMTVEDATGSAYSIRANDGVVMNNSYVKGTANETFRLLGSATFNGGFECAYLQGASTSKGGKGGTVTIEDGTTVHATYGVEFSNNYVLNGGTIELSGGNADGEIWGCVFQSGTYEINTDIVVTGGNAGTYAPIYFTNCTATINSTITQTNSNGEPMYIGENSVVTLGTEAVIDTLSVYGAGKLIIDATGMTAGEYANVKCGASAFTGTIEVINNDKLYAVVNDEGKIELVEYVAAITVGEETTYYKSLQDAITAAQAGETVEIIASELTFSEDAASIVIGKAITIDGNKNKLTFNSATSAFVIQSSNVTIKDMTIEQGTKDNSFHISVSKGAWDAPAIQYSNIKIENIAFVGGDYALCLIGETVTVSGCTFTDQDSHNIIIYSLKGNSSITGNTFNASKGNNKSAILYEGGADNATDTSGFIGGGKLTISGNTANSKGVFFQFTNWKLVKGVALEITGNKVDAFTNKAIALYDMDGALTANGDEFASVTVSENVFTNVPSDRPILKEYTGTVAVDASANYLGSESPDYAALLVGDKVTVKSYYKDEALTELVDLCVAYIGNEGYVTLQAAIDAAQNGDTITLMTACAENVIVPQQPDVKITIDGNGNTYTGSITVNGKSAAYATAGVTIKNVKFDATAGISTDACINLGVEGDNNTRYTSNVTVENCTFTGTESVAAIKSYTGGDEILTVTGCTATGMHSLIQVKNVAGLSVTGGSVTGGKNGISVGNSSDVVIDGIKIEATGYGIRADGDAAADMSVSNATITANDPIVVRKVTAEGYKLTANDNTLTTTNANGYLVTFTSGDDGTYEKPAVSYTLTSDLDLMDVFPQSLKGSGTETDPYLISNVEELIFFRDSVNAGETKYNTSGVYVALAADIDMTGVDWSVNIGDDCSATFDGIFDGKNYKISNLTSTETAQKSDGYICTGLFGAIYGSAQIKNLTISGANINTGSYTGNNVGVVVGFAYNPTGSITNVKVTGADINAAGAYGVGAIVGYAYYSNGLTIADCSVSGTTINAKSGAGGVIGYASGTNTIKNCNVSTLNASGTGLVGGIAGLMTGGTVSECTVNGAVLTTTGEYWGNSAAAAVGTLADATITVSGTYTNVTANGTATDAIVGSQYAEQPTSVVPAVEARIGNVYYTTIAAALTAAKSGDTIDLLADIEATEVILIDESLTINGNGHKVTSSATRVFRVTTSDVEVTLNNVNMVSNAVREGTNDIRGISIDGSTTGVKLTLNDCSVDFTDASANDWAYAVNVTSGSSGIVLNVSGGTYEGANVINVNQYSSAALTVTGATLNCMYPNHDVYYGYCITAWHEESTLTATGNTFNGANAVAISVGGTVTESDNTDNTTKVVAKVGDTYYTSLAEAFKAAVNDDTVTLLHDVDIDSETYTIADGVSITLDMSGNTLTVTDNKTSNYELFYIYGGLTVTGNGTITLTATNNRAWNAMSAIFHNRGGVLTIKDGTFTHKGGTDMAYVVDNSGNYYGDATTNIESGVLKSSYIAIRNRMEQNTHGASGKAILNVSGGTIKGTSRAIWAQAASTSTTAPATGEINISGGEIGLIDTARSAGAVSMTTISGGTVAAFKGEVGELTVTATGTAPAIITMMTADGEETPYAVTSEGVYVAPVAAIDGTYYATLTEAVSNADGKTITMLADVTLTAEGVVIHEGKKVTLDLNGKTITIGQYISILSHGPDSVGVLTVKDTVGGGKINSVVVVYGTLNLQSGTITSAGYGSGDYGIPATVVLQPDSYACYPQLNATGGAIAFTGNPADFGEGASMASAVLGFATNGRGPSLSFTGAAVTSTGGCVYVSPAIYDHGDITVTGGTFTGGEGYALFVPTPFTGLGTREPNIDVSGGTFSAEIPAEYCAEGYMCAENVDGTYSVVVDPAYGKVAKIGDNYYETLAAAIEAATADDTIVLIANTNADVVIAEDKTITIDLNGNDIVGEQHAITNNGTLTIKDTVGTGNVYTTDVAAQGRATIVNNGTLTINGGWFGDSNNDTTDRNAINRGNALKNYGTATINGGYFTNVSNQYIGTDAYAYAINTLTSGTTTINNATVYGDINGLIFSDGETVVNDGSFTLGRPNEENNLWYLAYGNVEIKGGTWNRVFAVPSWNTNDPTFYGAVAVSGGTFNVEVKDEYLADKYCCKANADGTYTVELAPVAKVGDTEYKTIDEAIAAWTNNTTLTLLADVTLSDVIKLSSTEYHVLDLGTYTMTAASGKDAIQIVNNVRSSASYALDIKADAENPGGITATNKTIVVTTGTSGVKDRPIIRFFNGVFNASNIVKHSGSNGTNCPQFYFYDGVYNGTINTNRSLNQFHGGTFNGSLWMSVDSSAYTLVAGGTFKQLSNLYQSALSSSKFTIGSDKGVYDREVYVDDNGYYVVADAAPAEGYEASIAKTPGTNDYLAYSKVATDGKLNYTDVYVALNNNKSADVTVYVDELDMTDISYKGFILIEDELTVTFAEGTTPAWKMGNSYLISESTEDGVTTQVYKVFTPVAKNDKIHYATIDEALAEAEAGDTVTIFAGDYTQDLSINKAITVVGETDADGKNLVNINGKLNITADGATAKNLNVNNGSGNAGYINAKNVLVEGCTVVGGNGFRSCYTAGTVTFKNSTITGSVYGIHFDGSAGGNIVIEGCTITGWTSFAGTIEKVTISDTEFADGNYDHLRFYQTAELTNVEFNPNMTVDFGKAEVTATFKSCSVTDNSALTDVIYLGDIAENGVKVYIDDVLVVVEAKTTNGDKADYYLTLEEAFANAADGDTITVLADATLAETITNTKSVTLNLNGKTVSYTSAVAGEAMITNNGNLTINGSGTIVYTYTGAADTSYGKGNYTIYNNGTLTLTSGTIENATAAMSHASYAISTGSGSSVTVNGGNVLNNNGHAIRMANFGSGAINVTVNGGTIEGTRAIQMQLTGTAETAAPEMNLTVKGGVLKSNESNYNLAVYVYSNGNSAENVSVKVEAGTINGNIAVNAKASDTMKANAVSITGGAINGEYGVFSYSSAEGTEKKIAITGGTFATNYSEQYAEDDGYIFVLNEDSKYVATAGRYVAAITANDTTTRYATLANALAAAQDGDIITLLWAEGNDPIAMNGAVYGKSVTITGTATVDWSKGWLFIGRGGEGDGTVIFDNASLTSASNSSSYGIHVSGREKDTTDKYDGTLKINNSTIELDYLINKGTITLDSSTLTVKDGFSVGGRPASETESGEDATATINLTNSSKVVVNNHNGMGLGYEAIGVMNIDATSAFETTKSFLVTAKGTMNVAGTATIADTLTNNGSIVLTNVAAKVTSSECGNVTTNVDDYEVIYADGVYSLQHISSGKINSTLKVYTDSSRVSVTTELSSLYAHNDLYIELYHGETLLSTTKWNKDYPASGSKTVSIVLSGTSSSWVTEWHEQPTVENVPDTIKLYVDGELVDTRTKDGHVLQTAKELQKYLALDEVYKEAMIGSTYYATLANALAAAQNGDTITLLVAVTADVTVDKSVTIDGANLEYTGNISVSGTSSAVTVKNVKFVNGTGYAITTNRITSITVEDCTCSNYGWGFLYANKSTPTVVVKNVTVNGGSYGMHWVYGTTATLENVTMTDVTYGLYIQNYADKTINVKNSKISSIAIWERSGYSGVQTFNFEGANTVGTLSGSEYAKYVLTATGATLTAPEGATVTTTVEGSTVKYADGTYKVVKAVAAIGDTLYGSIQDAVNAAQSGDTIKVIDSHEIDVNAGVKNSGNNCMLVNVDGKSVTIDLNGKSITVDMSKLTSGADEVVAVFATDNGGRLTLKGNGSVSVDGSSATNSLTALIMAYNGPVNIDGGSYSVDYLAEGCGMIYGRGGDHANADGSNKDQGVNIFGGTFTLGNVGTLENGSPWILNTAGQNIGKYIWVTGGTFNDDILHQYYIFEVSAPTSKALKNNGNGTWTIVDATAYLTHLEYDEYYSKIGYATLAEAIGAAQDGDTVTLLADSDADFEVSCQITLELNEKSYTGTVTLTIEAATLTAAEGLNVTTSLGVINDLEGYYVDYVDGVYMVKQYLLGDVNNDGVADITDVMFLLQYANNNRQFNFEFNTRNGDCTGDGEVDVADAMWLWNQLVN